MTGDPFDQLDQLDAQIASRNRVTPAAARHHLYRAAEAAQRLISRRRGERPCPNLHETPYCGLCRAEV